jgi:hypothetical protein
MGGFLAVLPKKTEQKKVQASGAGIGLPQVDGFKIKSSLTGTLKQIGDAMSSISFLEVAPEKDGVNAVYVESRDINNNPYLFSILKIKKDELEVVYSIPPEIAPRKRRMDMIRHVLNLLSLLEKYYVVENKVLYQLIEASVKELSEAVTMDYSKLYTSYDSLKKESDDLKKRVGRLQDETQALTTKNYELKNLNDELLVRNKELEALSDDVLKTKLQEWIMEHNGEMNIIEFSKLYRIPEAKVEQALNRLVAEGYLAVVQ